LLGTVGDPGVLTCLGDDLIDYDVPWVQQATPSQCWYAALQMIVEFRRGRGARFAGYPRVLQEGVDREKLRAEISDMADRGDITQGEAKRRREANPLRGINDDELPELADLNGLGVVALPQRDRMNGTGGWTRDTLEAALVTHGPLWCSVAFPGLSTAHVIVVKGVDAEGKVIFLDPQVNEVRRWEVAKFNTCLQWMNHCMMFLSA
jgi:hypothetical protein